MHEKFTHLIMKFRNLTMQFPLSMRTLAKFHFQICQPTFSSVLAVATLR